MGSTVAMGWTALSFLLILSSLLFPFVSANVASNDTTALDICAWGTDAMPILYHEYYEEDCPPVFHLKPDGNCSDYFIGGGADCASFCQIRTNFYYGQEQPYVRVPMCRGGTSCTLSESIHQNYAWKAKVNFNYKWQALTTGITGGYSEKSGISQGYKFNKQLQDNQCGYWTFIPFVKGTCGTYTEGRKIDVPRNHCSDSNTVGNACVEQLVDLDDSIQGWRAVHGIVVFVFVDCRTLQPLPDENQDVAFTQPGVKLPRGNVLSDAYENLWNQSARVALLSQNNDTTCANTDNRATNISDCVEAISDTLNHGGLLVDTTGATKGQGTTIGSWLTCTVWLSFDESWDGQDCKVSFLEVAAAAQAILDDCIGNDQIGGNHVVRGQGNCAATALLGNYATSDT